MYTTPDEDRSDLYLAGAVYVLGPQILGILFSRISLPPSVGTFVSLAFTIMTTVLVPFLLMRYRKERLRDYGFSGDMAVVTTGLIAALPVAVAFVLGNLIAGGDLLGGVRAYEAATGSVVIATVRIITGLCVALLAIYATVKARSAFRSDPRYVHSSIVQLGRIVAIVAAVAAVLLLATLFVQGGPPREAARAILVPLGVAGAVWLVYRGVSGSQLVSRPTLITPMVIMAIGSVQLFAPAFQLVYGLWNGALLAAIGLAIGVLLETRRSAWAPLGLALGLVLLSPLLG